MTVWFKQGVVGCLKQHAQKGFGKVAKLYEEHGEDMFVTAMADGNHAPGSFHYIGLAWDFRKGSVEKGEIAAVLGSDFDVVEHSTHYHVEYDTV